MAQENPIKYSDFIQPDNSVATLISQLEEVEKLYMRLMAELRAEAAKTEKALRKTHSATEDGREATRGAAAEAERLAKAYEDLKKAQGDNAKELARLKEQKKQAAKITRLETEANEALEGSLDKLKAQLKLNKALLSAMSKAQRESSAEGRKLTEQTRALEAELQNAAKAEKEAARLSALQAKEAAAAEGSYDKLSAQYSILKIRLNAMSKAQREGTEEGRALEKQAADTFAEMKRLQENTGKFSLDVGNYRKGWEGVKEELGDLKDKLGQVPGAAGQAVGGLDSLAAGFRALAANPFVLVLSAIIASLAALFNLFKRTKRGADLLAKGSAALSGIMSALVGVVDKLASVLIGVFEDPQQSMADFWEALKTNIVNRFKGLVLLTQDLGRAFSALWKRDLTGLKNAANSAAKSLVQLNTGLDAKQQKEFADAVKGTTAAIIEQAEAFAKLEEQRQKTRRANRELEKQAENLTTKEELLRATADDATKSFKEREAAAKEAAKLSTERAALQQRQAAANLALTNRELDLRAKQGENVEDLLDKQLEQYKILRQAQREYLLTVRDDEKRQSELKQDRLERDLDILIDGFDNQKSINERLIADDTKTFEERQKLLEETRALFENTFAKQIQTVEQFTDKSVNANDLINTSDAVALNQKIRSLGLSEIIEGRLLEIIRDRRTGLQDLAETERDLNESQRAANEKAAADAEAAAKAQTAAKLEALGQEKDVRLSEIDLMKTTEAEKTRLRLEAEKNRIAAVLELAKKGETELSALQIKALENTLAAVENKLAETSKEQGEFDLYKAVGLDLADDKKAAIQSSTQFAIGQLQDFLSAEIAASNAAAQAAQAETDAAQSRLDRGNSLREQGLANSAATAEAELAQAKSNQEKAIKEQRRAARLQQAIETAQQATSLITASAKIWGTLGFPLALPALGIMWGSFAAAKVRAAQVTRDQRQYKHGGFEMLKGGSHASGNDIPLGTDHTGTERRAEGGEALAVFSRPAVRKYKGRLPRIVAALNKGVFEDQFLNAYAPGGVELNLSAQSGGNADLSRLERGLDKLVSLNQTREYVDAKGRTVRQYKNLKTIK